MPFTKKLCIGYKDAIRELCIPECSAFGVTVSCEKCNKTWSKSQREWFFKNLKKAQQEIEDIFRSPLCPTEICQERVYLRDCPTELLKKPIAYLGKKELIESRTLQICYQRLSDCGADLPVTITSLCNEDNDYIGTVFITDLPEGYDMSHVEFRYPDFLCATLEQELQEPECETIYICDDEELGIEAIWPKCHLIHPNCDRAKLTQDDCFLTEIVVDFYRINEDLAIEMPSRCTCGKCSTCSNCGYTIELGDPLKGEVCISGEGCDCCDEDYIYVNYATALNCGQPNENLSSMITMLALIRRGQKNICDCDGGNTYIDYLMELDPSFAGSGSPFDTKKNFPFGKTRAAILAQRLMEEIREKMIFDGQLQIATGGMMTGISSKKKVFKLGTRRNW